MTLTLCAQTDASRRCLPFRDDVSNQHAPSDLPDPADSLDPGRSSGGRHPPGDRTASVPAYADRVFSPEGPSLRELAAQALTSVERGYDLLAPTFDKTPFRTPDLFLDAVGAALAPLGPFDAGLDVCCGTGAGIRVLRPLCRGSVTGVDFSAGMLGEAREAYGAREVYGTDRAGGGPQPGFVRADVRALPFAAGFDL